MRVVTNASIDSHGLAIEFPSVSVTSRHIELADGIVFDADSWQSSRSFQPFDDMVERSATNALVVRGGAEAVVHAVGQVLTRYQRFLDRRNAESDLATFDVVVRAHRAIHDERRSLGNADLARALDTWQWLLRVDPFASLDIQLVALFRDVERIDSEPWSRAPRVVLGGGESDGPRFGGQRTYNILSAAGFDTATAGRVRALIAREASVAALHDAEGLSFLSLSSSRYLDTYGRAATRRRIAKTLRRLRPIALQKLAWVRFRPDVFSVVREAA